MAIAKIKSLDHLVITSDNIEACVSFYTKLGFDARFAGDRWELFAGDFKINVHIKGKELYPAAKNIQCGSSDLCFIISQDITLFKHRLVSLGITPETEILERVGFSGPMHSFYVYDPDGNLIEFASYAIRH